MHHFLLEISMDTDSSGGLVMTQRLKVGELKIF